MRMRHVRDAALGIQLLKMVFLFVMTVDSKVKLLHILWKKVEIEK